MNESSVLQRSPSNLQPDSTGYYVSNFSRHLTAAAALLYGVFIWTVAAPAADWPQFGRDP